jgi:hydrogenase maturation protease
MNRLVIGIGNTLRGDDAAGLRVAEKLGLGDDVAAHDGEPASLMSLWSGRDEVVLVDAVTSGRAPGSIVELDVVLEEVPSGMCHSTHALGPAEAIELARALGKLPSKLTLIGIEGCEYSFGSDMSAAVESAVVTVVEKLKLSRRPAD